jgi:rhodanese-related sulfurtransferase
MDTNDRLRNLSPAQIQQMMSEGSIMLIDVREPDEYRTEAIPGALLFPLSTFDPDALPLPGDCEIVFQCRSGKRSATAVERCLQRGLAHTAHMAGGILAWKMAGFPTIASDHTL